MMNKNDLNQVDVDDYNPYEEYEEEDYFQSKPNKMKAPKFREHKSQ